MIEGIFYIQPSGKVQLLKSGLLYFPDGTFNQFNLNIESDLNKNFYKDGNMNFRIKLSKSINFLSGSYQSDKKRCFDACSVNTRGQNSEKTVILYRCYKYILAD